MPSTTPAPRLPARAAAGTARRLALDTGYLDELTPREREVLALMAEGRTNAAIAERLVVTGGAVEKHVASIFFKLGLRPSGADHRRVLAVLAWLSDAGGARPTG